MKILGIFVCVLMVVTIFSTMVPANGNELKVENNIINDKKETSNYNNNVFKGMFNKKTDNVQDIITINNNGKGEILDQYMDHTNGWGWWVAPWQWIAQGFKPTLDTLTMVELYYFRAGNPSNDIQIIVSIRDDLYGTDIVSYSVNAGQITHPGNWINVDLSDITVIPEQTYYIVCRATGGEPDNVYCWYTDINNPYTRGDAWGSLGDGYVWWLMDNPPDQPQTDCCFKTYGLGEPELKTTFIIGRISDVTTDEGFKTFKAVNIQSIQFSPFKHQKLYSGELIYVSDQYLGLLTRNFIFGLFKSSI